MQAVKDRLPSFAGGRVIITTRRNVPIRQITALDVDFLTEADSIALLEDSTQGHRRHAADDSAAILELAMLLGGLPLALTQAAAHISWQRLTYREYLDLWQNSTASALAWYNAEVMDYPKSLAVTYETSIAQLSQGAKDLLQILAWFSPEPIPRLLMDMKGLPAEAGAHLAELERMSLVRARKNGTSFTVHRLLQEITRLPQINQMPPSGLVAALNWLEEEFPFGSHDVSTWSVAKLLLPHATILAAHGDGYQIWRQTTCLQNRVGRFHVARAAFDLAEPLLRRALIISEATLGPVHPTLAKDLNNLALLLRDMNRLQEVEAMLRRALEIDRQVFGDDHLRLAIRQNNLAGFLRDTGCTTEAEPLFVSALRLFEKYDPGPSPDHAVALRNLASFYHQTNRPDLALAHMREAVEMAKAAFGENHPEYAASMNNLAVMLNHQSQRDEALELLLKVATIEEFAYGKKHPRFALTLNNLAMNYHSTGKLEEAEELMRQALQIDELTYGADHPDVARDLSNLTVVLQEKNRPAEAEPLNRRSLEILIGFSVNSGHLHPNLSATVQNYGNLLTRLGASKKQAEEKIDQILAPLRKK
jgi:tetratricopeptide (TPR) repeat protein